MKRPNFLALAAFCLISASAFAAPKVNPFPAQRFFPDPVGILFPGFNGSAAVNPASIPTSGKGTAVQVAYSPEIQSGDGGVASGSFATKRGNLGLNAGYIGTMPSGGSMMHGAYAGMGYLFEPVSVGFGVRDYNLSGGPSPDIDLGFNYGDKGDFVLGAVLYHLQNSPQLDIGVGTGSGKYNIELNVLMPPFAHLDWGYAVTASANIFTEIFGFHFRTTYFTNSSDFSHTLGAGAWLSEMLQLSLQYSTQRRATVAMNLVF